MRFGSVTVLLGLIAATCAVPLGVNSDITARDPDSLQYETRALDESDSVFAREESQNLGTRGLTYGSYIDITYVSTPRTMRPGTQDEYKQIAQELIEAAAPKLGVKNPKVHAENMWEGAASMVEFTFALPMKGKYHAKAFGGKDGQITQNGKDVYLHI